MCFGVALIEPRVDALERLDDVEWIHIHSAERRSIVRKRAIADCGPGIDANHRLNTANSNASVVSTGKSSCLEVVHDLLRMVHVASLIEIALHEPLHIRDTGRARVPAKDLQIDCRKMVVRIGIELSLKFRLRLRLDGRACRIRIAHLIGDPVDSGSTAFSEPSMWSNDRFSIIRTTICFRFSSPALIVAHRSEFDSSR